MINGPDLFLCSLQFYLHNHLSFILYFHREKVEEEEVHNYRVVRFEVVPQSVKVEGWCRRRFKPCERFLADSLTEMFIFKCSDLKAAETDKTCTLPDVSGSAPLEIDPKRENEVLFTYSVHWMVSICCCRRLNKDFYLTK